MTTTTTNEQPAYLVTVAQAARLLGAKPCPVLELCERGELPSTRIGERILIPREAVIEYADSVVRRAPATRPNARDPLREALGHAYYMGLDNAARDGRAAAKEAEDHCLDLAAAACWALGSDLIRDLIRQQARGA
jgi:excisionase family DNA binding protein